MFPEQHELMNEPFFVEDSASDAASNAEVVAGFQKKQEAGWAPKETPPILSLSPTYSTKLSRINNAPSESGLVLSFAHRYENACII